MNLTCAGEIVFRFYVSEGNCNPQYFKDMTEQVEEPDFPGEYLDECIASDEDFQCELFAWFRDKEWECGVTVQGYCLGLEDAYVEISVDWAYMKEFERIEQDILQFLIDEPDVELAKQRAAVRYRCDCDKLKFNPAYGVLLDGLNKMMGCS